MRAFRRSSSEVRVTWTVRSCGATGDEGMAAAAAVVSRVKYRERMRSYRGEEFCVLVTSLRSYDSAIGGPLMASDCGGGQMSDTVDATIAVAIMSVLPETRHP